MMDSGELKISRMLRPKVIYFLAIGSESILTVRVAGDLEAYGCEELPAEHRFEYRWTQIRNSVNVPEELNVFHRNFGLGPDISGLTDFQPGYAIDNTELMVDARDT
eukprot:UN02705